MKEKRWTIGRADEVDPWVTFTANEEDAKDIRDAYARAYSWAPVALREA